MPGKNERNGMAEAIPFLSSSLSSFHSRRPGDIPAEKGGGALTPSHPADNFHRESPSGRARSCQKATALAAATFRESTLWAMGIRTV